MKQAAELSGMSQSIGYVLAAVGPLFIGYLYDLTHLWDTPIITLIIVTILLDFWCVCRSGAVCVLKIRACL